MSIRAMLLAAIAHGESKIHNFLKSEDTYRCFEALKACGITTNLKESPHSSELTIQGRGGNLRNIQDSQPLKLYLGGSGITTRFLSALLAASPSSKEVYITGDETLRKRPMSPLFKLMEPLFSKPLQISSHHLPFSLTGNFLKGGDITLDAQESSSQFLSAMLMSAPLAREPITIHYTAPLPRASYIFMTCSLMKNFGVMVHHDPQKRYFFVQPAPYHGTSITIETDLSSGSYLLAYAALNKTTLTLTSMPTSSLQGDQAFISLLERMGCVVSRDKEAHNLTIKGPAQLKGGFSINMSFMADQALTLGCLATMANAPITMTHLGGIRHHECDRLEALSYNLKNLNIKVFKTDTTITIHPFSSPHHIPTQPTIISSFKDHRVVMSFAILSSRIPHLMIKDPHTVTKTFPQFFDTLERLGLTFKEVSFYET